MLSTRGLRKKGEIGLLILATHMINVKIIVMPMEINISMHDDQQEVQPCNEICIFWQQKRSAVHWTPSCKPSANGIKSNKEQETKPSWICAHISPRSAEEASNRCGIICWGILERSASPWWICHLTRGNNLRVLKYCRGYIEASFQYFWRRYWVLSESFM